VFDAEAEPKDERPSDPGVAFMNQELMQELARLNPKALAIYQLLGIQMQLKIQLR
jgi:hypothetical protein